MREEERPPEVEDRLRQQGLLYEALEWFPVTLTVVELVRTQATSRLGRQDHEPWEQALTALHRDGVLRLNGVPVEPTLAAMLGSNLLDIQA